MAHSHTNLGFEGEIVKTGSEETMIMESQEKFTTHSNLTSYQTIEIHPNEKLGKFSKFVDSCSLSTHLTSLIIPIILTALVWLVVYTIVGDDNLPGGVIFILFFLEFGGRIAGHCLSFLKIPPMVAMLGLGIIIRNVQYVDFGKYMTSDVASPIRQISLAVILTRAGLGLDINVLLKYKWLVARLAFFPAFIEGVTFGILVYFLLDFPWLWSFLAGFVIAAVSPAVIVPRILALKEQGYGVNKGIPTIILASASLDNIVSITLFGIILGFTFSNKSLPLTILQGPLEVIIGCTSGVIWGCLTGLLFSSNQTGVDYDKTMAKILMVLGGGVSSVLGYNRLEYTSAGVLSCLISAFTAGYFWNRRGATADLDVIKWVLTMLWKFFEPLLFGVIGCQIVVSELKTDVVLLGLGCLGITSLIRFVITFGMVCRTKLNIKEKTFVSISWIAKATVQAAIGPQALDLAQKSGDIEKEELGQKVLTLAVLVILLTAPLGELGVIISGPKLLKNQNQTDSSHE